MVNRSIVLLSGGLDSAVALYWALHDKHIVRTLTFNYFRRSRKEIVACERISRRTGAPNMRIDLPFLREVEDSKMADNRNPILKRAQSAYIPCRNIIFYGIAASFAEIWDASYIVGGHNKNDTCLFPDSSPKFFSLFDKTASYGRISGTRTGKIILPLSRLDKSQVIRLGEKLGVPFEMTWSCYTSHSRPCEKCLSCRLRRKAFKEAGVRDPLLMAHS
jgi:7-cyano-7-deazaguanine synthase